MSWDAIKISQFEFKPALLCLKNGSACKERVEFISTLTKNGSGCKERVE